MVISDLLYTDSYIKRRNGNYWQKRAWIDHYIFSENDNHWLTGGGASLSFDFHFAFQSGSDWLGDTVEKRQGVELKGLRENGNPIQQHVYCRLEKSEHNLFRVSYLKKEKDMIDGLDSNSD